MAKIYASRSAGISQREQRNMERSRRIAAQGMVLLENDGVLPLKSVNGKIALYGSGARRTVKGGTGSGDVNSRMVVNAEQGLTDAGFRITTGSWLDRQEELCKTHFEKHVEKVTGMLQEKGPAGIAEILSEPYRDPDEPEITKEDISSSGTDTAVYVLARTSGEGKDRIAKPGDYELSENEAKNIKAIAKAYGKTVVVLNVGGIIDTKLLRSTEGIHAVLLMSQPGNISGWALADILTGKETPSGHLTATWAENYSDYPCADTFSYRNHDLDDEYYNEGIYVGYRYFDTFGITPAYPFGYGLSYTTFSRQTQNVSICGDKAEVKVKVANTGSQFPGKEVVQVYVSAPKGQLEKPYQELAGFVKTKELKAGESQEVEIAVEIASLASYDEVSASYILEAGDYIIRVGNHSRNTKIAAILRISDRIITKTLKNRLVPEHRIEELTPQNVAPYSYEGEAAEKELAPVLELAEPEILKKEVIYKEEEMHPLAEKLSVQELTKLCIGSARGGFGSGSTIGAASTACPGAAGDTTSDLLETRGVPNLVLADGPAGLRLSRSFAADSQNNIIPGLGESAFGGIEKLFGKVPPKRPDDAIDYYQYCTAIPIAMLLAQTWDEELIEEAGDIVGEEMEEFGVTLWLAPGMNIQRNPLCGRNFEYYSEDPLVAGRCAAADTKGVQKHPGCGTTIKHFAMNNLEDNRAHNNSQANERAIREIYLKGFEIAINESQPLAVMTSYNLLNGVHTANSHELLTDILRGEWNYEGLVMTDWGTTGGGDMNPALSNKYGTSSAAECIKAGNDLIMPGSQQDEDDIVQAVREGLVSREELQKCASRVLKTIEKSKKWMSK